MIKKIFSILFLLLWGLGLMAQTDVNLYTLSTAVQPTKAGTVSSTDNQYEAGSNVWVYTYGNDNYRFKCWMTDDNVVVSTESGFYFTMPDKDVTLTAVYEYDPESPANPNGITSPHTLTLKASPSRGGYFNYGGSLEFKQGDEVYLYAYSNSNYQFKHWEYMGEIVSTNYDYVFTMPDAPAELVAVFTYNPISPSNPGSNSWDASTSELIIDDFRTGELRSAIENATGGSSVQKLVVIGKIYDYDIGSIGGMSIANVDLSRSSGATSVHSWSFSSNENVTEISLPSSITYIEYGAFSDCPNLTTVNCFAAVPPTIDGYVFGGIESQVTIYVPADSWKIYQNAPGWKNFNILPMGNPVYTVEVDLPEETYTLYQNMYVKLTNSQSGEVKRYAITNHLDYYFNNLVPGTVWTASVENAKGQVLGVIENIEIQDKNHIVQFESLVQPQTIRAEVLADDKDVSGLVSFTWLNADGSFLGQGVSVSGVLPFEGTTVKLSMVLSDELAKDFKKPADVVYAVKESDNLVITTLEALPKVTITGRVKDVTTGNPITGAVVTVSQPSYNKAFTVKTDAQGVYTIANAYIASTEVSVSATDYVGQSVSYESLDVTDGAASIDDIALKGVNGAHITVNYTYTLCAEAGQTGEKQEFFTDYVNVTYAIRDLTTNQDVKLFTVKGQEIVLQENLNLGDQLQLIATSKTGAFAPLTATGVIDANNRVAVTFDVKQLGQLRAAYVSNENPAVTGVLYDANGKFLRSADYEENTLLFTDLADGKYTLVTMGSSVIFNSIYDFGAYAESGLTRGKDYTSTSVNVESGIISVVKIPFVPYLNLSKFDYVGTSTTFTVNKNITTIGNNLTFTGFINFKEKYAQAVSDVSLVIDLPENCNMVNGSAMVGSNVVTYQLVDSRLTIPVNDINSYIRFCCKPVVAGEYAPSAYVQFTIDGQQMKQPVGNASFVTENMGISVPNTINTATFPASGTALPRSIVKVYDDEILVGMALALANGTWSATCELVEPENGSKHSIYAVISASDSEMTTETQTLTYEVNQVELNTITMLNTAHPATSLALRQYTTIFNFQRPQAKLQPYWYWPDYPDFTFLVDFSDNSKVKAEDFELIVFTSDNRYISLKPVFNARRNKFVVTHKFYYYALPISVNIRRIGDNSAPRMFTRVEYVLDPSGYVYEGVPTNRLEGVKATIYYRKDENSAEVLWDASSYEQENPLFTDEYGMYAWDVPEGQWQVRFEKEGYEPTQSAWLPVPPPQLKVNIPMVQSTAPRVISASADESGVEIGFDKYMKAETLTTDNIIITRDGEVIRGSVELQDAENASEDDENSESYASKLRFNFENYLSANGEVQIFVNTLVKSYASLGLADAYVETIPVVVPVKTVEAANADDGVFAVEYEGTRTLIINALPEESAAGKTLKVQMLSTTIANIVEDDDADGEYEVVLDEYGSATITISGDLPGSTPLLFFVEGTEVKGQVLVNVQQVKSLISKAPRASYASGDYYRGTRVNLISEDENAKIYYTISTNGEDPVDPGTESELFTAPVSIDANLVKIKAVAKVDGFAISDVVQFNYGIKQNTAEMSIKEGWNWVSHNLSTPIAVSNLSGINSILEVKSQRRGVVRDEVYGLFGNLTQMEAKENYKIRANASTKITRSGDAFNATQGVINLNAGWNWIGYPMKSTMALNDALANLSPSEGDVIMGLGESAEFDGSDWVGDLTSIVPGQGYMIKVKEATDLLYSTTSGTNAMSKRRTQLYINETPWSVDIHRYPDVMPMRLSLYRGNVPTEEGEYYVAAFCGTECRGIGKSVNGVIFMNIHGEGKENITFLAVENNTGKFVSVEETIPFQNDVVGSLQAPYILHAEGDAVGIQSYNNQMGVWPAVARTEINVSFAGKAIDRVTITGTDGKIVYTSSVSDTQHTINVSNLTAGVYIVTAQSGKEFFYKKITKVNK